MKNIIILFNLIFLLTQLSAQDIALTLSDKVVSNNEWSFTLNMTIVNTSGGNWGTMNIRNNVQVPSGVLINHALSTVTPLSNQVDIATITSFTGGAITGTDKLSLNLIRNTSTANLSVGTTIPIASYTINFSSNIPASNLVTPRDFASSGNGATFWVDKDDPLALRRPFNIYPAQPLPIDIKTFSATKDGDRNARLDWSTSLEINSAYFGVERSTDGKSWELLDQVLAAGNSNTEQLYTYTDRDLPLNRSKDQIFYYRLQLVDLDGQYKYSDIRGVNFGKENTNKVISLYPNPAVQMVNLDLSGMDLESGAIHLRVTDMQGRNMIDKTILGNGIEPIEVTQLPAGTYNVAVSQGANLYQKQFIKIE